VLGKKKCWEGAETKKKAKDKKGFELGKEREHITRFPVCYVSCGVHTEREV